VEQPACHGGPERRQVPGGTTRLRRRIVGRPLIGALGHGHSWQLAPTRPPTWSSETSTGALRAVAPCWAAASPAPTARFHVEHAVGRQSTRREVPRGTPPRRRVAARPLVGATRHGPSARQDPDRQLLRPRAATRRRWLQDMLLGGRPPSLAPRFPGFHVEHPSGSDADGRRRRSGFQVEHPACGAGSQVGGSSGAAERNPTRVRAGRPADNQVDGRLTLAPSIPAKASGVRVRTVGAWRGRRLGGGSGWGRGTTGSATGRRRGSSTGWTARGPARPVDPPASATRPVSRTAAR
jgi:hypothetical protein